MVSRRPHSKLTQKKKAKLSCDWNS